MRLSVYLLCGANKHEHGFMSAFHYKGELLGQNGPRLTYRFFPECVAEPDVWGEFVVDTEAETFEITRSSGKGMRSGVSVDEKCVSALLHKLKKREGAVPESLHFIA